MSEENVEIVRAVIDAQQRRDWLAFRGLYDPSIEWHDVSGLWGDWGTRRGFEAVRDAWISWFEAFEHVSFEIKGAFEIGDEVFTSIKISARGRGSGLDVDQKIACLWMVQRGRVVRVRAYREEAEALEAAGLSE